MAVYAVTDPASAVADRTTKLRRFILFSLDSIASGSSGDNIQQPLPAAGSTPTLLLHAARTFATHWSRTLSAARTFSSEHRSSSQSEYLPRNE
jgi:hypothetical protein